MPKNIVGQCEASRRIVRKVAPDVAIMGRWRIDSATRADQAINALAL